MGTDKTNGKMAYSNGFRNNISFDDNGNVLIKPSLYNIYLRYNSSGSTMCYYATLLNTIEEIQLYKYIE